MTEQQSTIVPDGLVGKTIGKYIVRYKLGEGGMGSVYFAEHPRSASGSRSRCYTPSSRRIPRS